MPQAFFLRRNRPKPEVELSTRWLQAYGAATFDEQLDRARADLARVMTRITTDDKLAALRVEHIEQVKVGAHAPLWAEHTGRPDGAHASIWGLNCEFHDELAFELAELGAERLFPFISCPPK